MREPVKRVRGWGGGIEGVDEGIRDIVRDLNASGYRTWASCSGGRGHESPNAWVSFTGNMDLDIEEVEALRNLIKSHTDAPFKLVGKKQGEVVHIESLYFKGPLREPPYTKKDLRDPSLVVMCDWEEPLGVDEEDFGLGSGKGGS